MATVLIVGGPAGTGKTTIASLLAESKACPFVEGDTLHPQANVDKMARGEPLTDEDRWGWLKELSEICSKEAVSKENATHTVVASCSILKKVYREYIVECGLPEVTFKFVFLKSTFEQLMERVANRKNHFMKVDMVKSQYDIMEIPQGEELIANGGSALAVETTDKTPEAILQEVLAALK
ncbi:putative gluconokinase [Clavispora lusitaniae]|uniref:Gluconokinase n=2 Tax=Clavispora lusitaniae TaxID=36911 RepID=A0ACD0WR37_CLALS|nr:putative gluconokinase [Clavispora lusitaniae]QFZ29818.1 putative gluconokinase [Clavispora lusitaniae]QFZ35468.1 putative gluconokinase [Clavispora lusitaniae]QFZ41162.1 putative gluconokinase [Clavispora lusitaniae]QFZ46843.1 putative gluconokinase [Clavispora lusitaniae]